MIILQEKQIVKRKTFICEISIIIDLPRIGVGRTRTTKN